ncbi:alpha/beta fold hydrolase [Streptomyces sp. NBC_01622]|uniref:alpha/beta hydrolase family protein n=1 Tax=Streptomyces sp. NBC_01622 TaxID=2975903 RepID=UPI00386556BE|nr:alpha/beta fold hydrolase [Streptomyces sp. NBC_01622]
MHTVKATAAAVSVALAAGAVGVAAGRYASDAALKAPPGRPLPTEPRLTVHATAAGQITLTRDLASLRPGTYGLAGDGSHAVVGPVIDTAPLPRSRLRPTGGTPIAHTVVRRLERVTHGTLHPRDKVWLTPNLHIGNPSAALGLDHADIDIPGELGSLPAWFVPGARSTWVIAVHGLAATRELALNVMEFLHRNRFPVLAPAYRGDLGAPRNPDGLGHLGETEWRDLDAAIRYAVRYGAEHVVLYGWSTGATMALRAAAHSGMRDRVSGLVLDSPVLDWETTLRALATARHTPGALLPLAVRAAQGRTGLHGDRIAEAADPARLKVPTLIFHGPDDTVAPWSLSRRFAARRPDLITLQPVARAPHSAMWNADPAAYEEILRRFLTPLM